MKNRLKTIVILLCILSSPAIFAGGVYQEPADFVSEVFADAPPKAKVLWLNDELKQQITKILDHKYKGMRVRYWQQGKKSVWILEEIGKEKQITAGIVINKSKIEQVKVLVFRESRGWEIRHDFFTDQFKQASLEQDNRLDTNIDNISGATLSVRAIKKLARIALLLDQHIQDETK